MKPTEELKNEHRGIERMISVTERAAQRLEQGKDVPSQVFVDAADFFRNFADKCHHSKEETELFPALEKAGIPRQGGPIAVMLSEHEQGRSQLKAMAAAADRYAKGDATARAPLIAAVRGYSAVLRAHIQKEDNMLFPMADQALSTVEQTRLVSAFEHIEDTIIGAGTHERYHAMLDTMEKQAAGW